MYACPHSVPHRVSCLNVVLLLNESDSSPCSCLTFFLSLLSAATKDPCWASSVHLYPASSCPLNPGFIQLCQGSKATRTLIQPLSLPPYTHTSLCNSIMKKIFLLITGIHLLWCT